MFLRDLQWGTNYAITTSTSGAGAGAAAMTPDAHFIAYGRANPTPTGWVVWNSQAQSPIYTNTTTATVSNIVISPDGNRIAYAVSSGLYVTDRAAKSNWLVSASILVSHAGLQFSADSRLLLLATAAAQVASDTNGLADVYLYDCQTRSNFLVSQSGLWPGAANGPSDSPAISADGRFIAYRSSATDLVPGITNGLPNIFIYDRQTSNTTLVSISAYGNSAGNNRSLLPVFSGNSQTLVFQSWAADLAAQDFNQSAVLFSVNIYPAIAPLPFIAQLIFAPLSSQTPALSWPAVAGKTYQVQFKNNLSDSTWQNLNGTVTVVSNTASTTDLTPSSTQRFYRIQSN